MDSFVDDESLAITFKMKPSLLGGHLTTFGNGLVSLQIISM